MATRRTGSALMALAAAPPPRKRARATEADSADDDFGLADLPSDTAAALMMHRARFQQLVPVAPTRGAAAARALLGNAAPTAAGAFEAVAGCAAVLTSQLRDALGAGAAAVDGELAALRAAGHVVVCAAPGGDAAPHVGDAVVAVSDVRAYARRALAAAPAGSARAAALRFYDDELLPTWCRRGGGIAEDELEAALGAWEAGRDGGGGGNGAAGHPLGRPRAVAPPLAGRGLGAGGRAVPAHAAAAAAVVPELLRCGLLLRRGDRQFAWGVPESARLWEIVGAGRTELLARLRQRRYRELPRDALSRAQLARSPLHAAFHVADLVGSGRAAAVTTAAGTFVRLVEK